MAHLNDDDAKYFAERMEKIREMERELDREDAERVASASSSSGKGESFRFFLVVFGLLSLGIGALGVSVTLSRLAGGDMADAQRRGKATVSYCVKDGPVTNKGFGYWETCTAKVVWDGGVSDRLTVGAVFTSADIGKTIEVGDLGIYRGDQQMARADVAARPWLKWIGYGIAAVGGVPGLLGVLMLSSLGWGRGGRRGTAC